MKYSNPGKTSSTVHPAVLHQCPKRARKQQQQQQQQQPKKRRNKLENTSLHLPHVFVLVFVPPTFDEKSLRGDEVETPRGIIESLRGEQGGKNMEKTTKKRWKKGRTKEIADFLPSDFLLIGGEGAWKMEGVCFFSTGK